MINITGSELKVSSTPTHVYLYAGDNVTITLTLKQAGHLMSFLLEEFGIDLDGKEETTPVN